MSVLVSAILYAMQILAVLLGVLIVHCCFVSLFKNLSPQMPLIVLLNKFTNEKIPITYWENSLGRNKHCDVVINSPAASRDHAVLFRRDDGWKIADTNSSGGIFLNGELVNGSATVCIGDIVQIGGIDFEIKKADILNKNKRLKKLNSSYSSKFILTLVSFFMLISCFQIWIASGVFDYKPLLVFAAICGFSWVYFLVSVLVFKKCNFEIEILGLFLSSIGIINALAANCQEVYTQIFATAIGVCFFSFMVFILKNPDFAMKCRIWVAVLAVVLLALNLVFGKVKNGSQNWVHIGGFSFQPSEIVKVAFVFFGSSTLHGLQTTKNLTGFIFFSAICMASLFIMGDFGSACVFFVTFILIAFMRSGSIRTVFLTCSAAFFGLCFILKFKPYVASRFSAWRHVWQHINDIGYQQTRVLTYSASGGLFGLGLGKGYLKYIFAAPSDLVFGMLCEEWGLAFAVTVLLALLLLGIYAKKASVRSRSAFYTIASCCAAGMLIFQAMLNVFGVVDIFPLTGVTLPFVSLGGSSMISAWGLLAFIKAADERTYALK